MKKQIVNMKSHWKKPIAVAYVQNCIKTESYRYAKMPIIMKLSKSTTFIFP